MPPDGVDRGATEGLRVLTCKGPYRPCVGGTQTQKQCLQNKAIYANSNGRPHSTNAACWPLPCVPHASLGVR